jgi:GTPase
LFNRLTQSRAAIVSNIPGTTRDRREGKGFIAGLPMNVIDTGGLDDRGVVSLSIQEQVCSAMQHADVVLFLIDAKTGLTALDQHFAKWLREQIQKQATLSLCASLDAADVNSELGAVRVRPQSPVFPKKVIVVANKTEGAHLNDRVLDIVSESYRLGFEDPLLISATHGEGMSELATMLIELAKARGFQDDVSAPTVVAETVVDDDLVVDGEQREVFMDRTIQLAIMGRPNVGE